MHEYKTLPRKPKFTNAEPKSFLTNYFTLNFVNEDCQLYQYSFSCDPEVPQDSTSQLRKIVSNVYAKMKEKIGLVCIRGNSLYGMKEYSVFELSSVLKIGGQQIKYDVITKLTKHISLKDLLHSSKENERMLAYQIINITTKQKLKKMDMIQLSKGKFYKKLNIVENDFKNGFFALKGFKFTMCPLYSGLYLQVDVFSRLIRQRNLLQEINAMKSADQINSQLESAIVIARYGNHRTYQIVSVDFSLSPMSKFTLYNQRQPITYRDYFKIHYGEEIRDLKQPLVYSISKIEKQKKEGKMEKIPTYVYLVPEMLSLVGLSDEHRKDTTLMRDIISRTQYSAENRLKEIQSIAKELNEHEGLYKIGNPKRMPGYRLEQPKIQLHKLVSTKNGEIRLTHELIKEPAKFQNWYLIYNDKYHDQAQTLEDSFIQASKAFGIKFSDPVRFNMGKSTSPEEYMEEINLQIEERKKLPEVILFLVGNFHKESFYAEMKSFCTLQLKIPSQFLTIQKFMGQKKKHGGLLSLASNVILQMNVKIGKVLWQVPIRNSDLQKKKIMCGSMAVSKVNKQYCLGFVGTTNEKLTKIYNETKIKKKPEEFDQALLAQIFVNWIKIYFQSNNRSFLPDVIIIYRQGMSQSQITSSSMREIEALKEMVEIAKVRTKNPNFNPELVYFSVNRGSSSRYYEDAVAQQKFSPKFSNPSSGSVILDEMSMPNMTDFHLTPHNVSVMTTSSPCQYVLCHQEPKKTPYEALVEFTFEQCWNYYNWKGAIKFPACLQNANKLSKLAGKSLKEDIKADNKMAQQYHFL